MSTFDGIVREYPFLSIDMFTPQRPSVYAYFLSHCHADHMVGLACKNWPADRPIYCSELTAKMLMHLAGGKYRPIVPYLVPLSMNRAHVIPIRHAKQASVSVVLLEANHCPGSVMFLIQGSAGSVLYTGDFRAESVHLESLRVHPLLSKFCSKPWIGDADPSTPACSATSAERLQTIYLDTTFCHETYRYFPAREDVISDIIALVRGYPDKAIYLDVSASIGYERVFCAIYEAFGEKIHVHANLYRMYQHTNLLRDYRHCITNESHGTRIHACGMKPKHGQFLPCCPQYGADYARIRPAAFWFTHGESVHEVEMEYHERSHRVAYSMHSSLQELQSFVNLFQPVNVFPTVYRVPAALTSSNRRTSHNGWLLRDILSHLDYGEFKGALAAKRKNRRSSGGGGNIPENLGLASMESNQQQQQQQLLPPPPPQQQQRSVTHADTDQKPHLSRDRIEAWKRRMEQGEFVPMFRCTLGMNAILPRDEKE